MEANEKGRKRSVAKQRVIEMSKPEIDLNKPSVQMRIIRQALLRMNSRADMIWTVNNRPNWAIVQDILTSHTSKGGSTSAVAHCRWLGIDPDGHAFKDLV